MCSRLQMTRRLILDLILEEGGSSQPDVLHVDFHAPRLKFGLFI